MEAITVSHPSRLRHVLLCTLPMPLLTLWFCVCAQYGAVEPGFQLSVLWGCLAAQVLLSCAAVFLFSTGSARAGAAAVIFLQAAAVCAVWDLSALFLLLLPLALALFMQDRKVLLATGAAVIVAALCFVLLAWLRRPAAFEVRLAGADAGAFYSRTVPVHFVGITVFTALFASAMRSLQELHFQKNMAYLSAQNERLNVINKNQFQISMKRILNAHRGTRYLLVVTDFLQFRMFNDYFGHESGDRLLRVTGALLADYAGSDGLVGHLGDDHMIALMPASRFDEALFTEKILQNPAITTNSHYRVEIICGIYEINDMRIAADVMCDRTLIACRYGKKNKAAMTFYQENMLSMARRNLAMLNEIVHALDTHQFIAYIQPQCDGSGKLLGGEVLARWQHPISGIIRPADFIPTCEECGLISRLDREMWERACQILHSWDEAGMPKIPLSVNLSPLDLYELDVPKEISRLIRQYHLTPDQLHLEITETAMMKDSKTVIPIIHTLCEMGFTVELDDFGSGYSSLGMISELELDVIKLDMSFLRRLDVSPYGRNVLKMVADMAAGMNIKVVVEGVEKASHLEQLEALGYKYFQGMYFSAPISVQDFEDKYFACRVNSAKES